MTSARHRRWWIGCAAALSCAGGILGMMCTCAEEPGLTMTVDPVTRYVHVRYPVPSDATDEVVVRCAWSPPGANAWRPAKVFPLISETALGLVRVDEWGKWVRQGEVVERRAAGLERTVVFNPYPEAQQDGRVDVDFHVEIHSTDGELLGTRQERIQTDNTDVVYIEDWSGVLQRDAVSVAASPEERKWWWRTGLEAEMGATFGNGLSGASPPYLGLPPLSYPLNLQGVYAVFVCTVPDAGAIGLRLSGDERTDRLVSRLPGEEVLWRWPKMDRQHLVLKQPHEYTGWAAAGIDYVKLVPLTDDLARSLDASFQGEVDKLIAGYWEPYSWAFNEDVQETLQHREPLSAFAEARIAIVDTQIGRFGMKVVYESRVTDPLFYATIGDPIGAIVQPRTDNVGRMQQFTNTLDATLRYARELGFTAHANFGASNCYPGSPLQGDFSKAHPEWMRGSALRYETPEVRAYALGLYREALEIGAPGVSIDFCRYPETIDTAETCNTFLRDLRALTDEFSRLRGTHVPILVRFPGTGVRLNELFDYPTWIRERWVDYLCPSNIQGRHHHIDVTPYLEAAQGSECTLLPVVDGLSWGLPMPGPFLWRVAQLYEAGAPGVYIYQADGRVLGRPEDRRCMRLLASSENVRQWWEAQDRMRPLCSKGIYITAPHQIEGYNRWERLRIWSEGVPTGPMETYLDGQLVGRVEGPPYLVGSEDTASDAVIPPGDHQLRIRAQDGEGWLEQTFAVHGAG